MHLPNFEQHTTTDYQYFHSYASRMEHKYKDIDTQTDRDKTPILYKRDWRLRCGSGRRPGWGLGVASSATSSTIIMSSTWASVVPAGKVPKDTTPTTSTASLPVLARRVLADPHEIGRFEGIGPGFLGVGRASWSGQGPARELVDKGQHIEVSAEHVAQGQRPRAGHCRRLWERLWGWRLELGANTYGVLVPAPVHHKPDSWESLAWKSASSTGVSVPLVLGHEPCGAYALRQRCSTGIGGGCWSPRQVRRQAEGGYNHDFAKRESAPGSRLVFNALSPHWRGAEDDKDGQEAWFTARIASHIG